jgi:hypothetical protein
VDGLIYCASMVLLDAARRDVTAPPLARWLLAAGIGATLFANVWAGLPSGPLGAAVAAWPAAALVGSYELLMLLIRSGVAAVPGDEFASLNGHRQAADLFADDIRGPGARYPRYPFWAARRPGQGQPGTGVPAHPHPYPVSRPGRGFACGWPRLGPPTDWR